MREVRNNSNSACFCITKFNHYQIFKQLLNSFIDNEEIKQKERKIMEKETSTESTQDDEGHGEGKFIIFRYSTHSCMNVQRANQSMKN